MIPKYNIGQQVIILDPKWKNNISINNHFYIHKIKIEDDQIVYKLYEKETNATLGQIRENKLMSILLI